MVNLKPKLKINKFTGSGDGLLYYNEGFLLLVMKMEIVF